MDIDGDFYILPQNFDFFWRRIYLIPLPEFVAGATTIMLTIYLNTLPKSFNKCKSNDEKEKVYKF